MKLLINQALAAKLCQPPSGGCELKRGSGTVEQDANIIIMPHREVYYDNQANPHEAELIIAKNRDGEMGTVVCGFEGNHARFVNEPNPWQPPKKQEWHGYAD